jgi:hypothetical protein
MLLIVLWMASACTTNGKKPPDFVACTNLGDVGYCRTYETKKKFVIDSKHPYTSTLTGNAYSWADMVQNSILIPADWFVEMKNYFDDICHANQALCNKNVGDWQGLANDLIAHIKDKKP